MTTPQDRYIARLKAKAQEDPRIRAAWLAGSFGKGMADRWSDVDAHLLVEASCLADFKEGAQRWLAEIRPLVFLRWMFEGRMVNAMTDEAMRLDVWLHGGERGEPRAGEACILYAQEDALRWQARAGEALSPDDARAQLRRAVPEFWRCLAMLPVVPGRDERLIGAAGNFLILMLLSDVLAVAGGRRRDRGVKALNGYLPPQLRRQAEEAAFLPDLSLQQLARFQLRLARIMRAHGPAVCEKWGAPYPRAMEEAVLAYLRRELAALGLDDVLEELG